MKSALLGSLAPRRWFPPFEANRIAMVVIMAVGAASASCTQFRGGPEEHPSDGGTTNDGNASGGSAGTGTDGGASPGGADGGSTGDAGPGDMANTGGRGGTPSISDPGGTDGSGGNGDPTDAGVADAATGTANLTVEPSGNHDFGTVEIGTTTGAKTFTITNTGDVPTGTLTRTNSNPAEMAVSGCGASLPGHGTCTLAVTFTPAMAGRRTSTLTLSASSGMLVITVSGAGAYRLTVLATGNGTVTSSPLGLTCNGATCTGLLAGAVMLHSIPGPDQLFAGWSGDGCPTGVVRDCSLTVGGTTMLKVSFVPQTDNLAFVTSMGVPSTLGASGNYDKQCNNAATAAGINNSAGDAFIALVSSSTSDVKARIGNARGWQRLDGRPVMDTLARALEDKEVFNAVVFDEKGGAATKAFVMTGIGADGRVSPTENCADFTVNTGALVGGWPDGGAASWASTVISMCASSSRLVCLGKTRSRTVKPTVTAGKRIWITSANFEVGGAQTPDAACQASLPSGVTTAAALISRQTRPAADVLSRGTLYVRPDGTLVGTGMQIGAAQVESGIWQQADGTYLYYPSTVWTGSPLPSAAGTGESTCIDWASKTNPTMFGATYGWATKVSEFWSQVTSTAGQSCSASVGKIYCVQTAP